MANWSNNQDPPITDTLPCGHHVSWLRPICDLPSLPLSQPITTNYCLLCELTAANTALNKEISTAMIQLDRILATVRKLKASF